MKFLILFFRFARNRRQVSKILDKYGTD